MECELIHYVSEKRSCLEPMLLRCYNVFTQSTNEYLTFDTFKLKTYYIDKLLNKDSVKELGIAVPDLEFPLYRVAITMFNKDILCAYAYTSMYIDDVYALDKLPLSRTQNNLGLCSCTLSASKDTLYFSSCVFNQYVPTIREYIEDWKLPVVTKDYWQTLYDVVIGSMQNKFKLETSEEFCFFEKD